MARFTRTRPAPVVTGPYSNFRPYVRADFEQCCAYCLLHELWGKGEEDFDIDHFRPKGKFSHLIRDFYNLYYCCKPCNSVRCKWHHWPSDELVAKGIGFVDLCRDDFGQHYTLLADGRLEPLTASARYTIDVIRLNRKPLVFMRAQMLRLGYELGESPE